MVSKASALVAVLIAKTIFGALAFPILRWSFDHIA